MLGSNWGSCENLHELRSGAELGFRASGSENFWEFFQIRIWDLKVRRKVEEELRHLSSQVAGPVAGGIGRLATGMDRLHRVRERVRGQWVG